MAEELTELSFDYDGSYKETKAVKHDGYAETSESVTRISPSSVFTLSTPRPVSIWQLRNMETPDNPPNDSNMAYLTFRNDFMAVIALNESPQEIMQRTKVAAIAHTRIRRQTSMKDASARASSTVSDAFKFLAIGMAAMGVISLFMIAVLVVIKGEP